MALDVGIVTLKYMERLTGPTYKFACHLAEYYWEADWQFGEEGNTLAQYLPETLERLAKEFAESEGLRPDEKAEVLKWVTALPYDTGAVTLHFSV